MSARMHKRLRFRAQHRVRGATLLIADCEADGWRAGSRICLRTRPVLGRLARHRRHTRPTRVSSPTRSWAAAAVDGESDRSTQICCRSACDRDRDPLAVASGSQDELELECPAGGLDRQVNHFRTSIDSDARVADLQRIGYERGDAEREGPRLWRDPAGESKVCQHRRRVEDRDRHRGAVVRPAGSRAVSVDR